MILHLFGVTINHSNNLSVIVIFKGPACAPAPWPCSNRVISAALPALKDYDNQSSLHFHNWCMADASCLLQG